MFEEIQYQFYHFSQSSIGNIVFIIVGFRIFSELIVWYQKYNSRQNKNNMIDGIQKPINNNQFDIIIKTLFIGLRAIVAVIGFLMIAYIIFMIGLFILIGIIDSA